MKLLQLVSLHHRYLLSKKEKIVFTGFSLLYWVVLWLSFQGSLSLTTRSFLAALDPYYYVAEGFRMVYSFWYLFVCILWSTWFSTYRHRHYIYCLDGLITSKQIRSSLIIYAFLQTIQWSLYFSTCVLFIQLLILPFNSHFIGYTTWIGSFLMSGVIIGLFSGIISYLVKGLLGLGIPLLLTCFIVLVFHQGIQQPFDALYSILAIPIIEDNSLLFRFSNEHYFDCLLVLTLLFTISLLAEHSHFERM